MSIEISPLVSLGLDVFPQVSKELEEKGYSLLKMSGASKDIASEAISACSILGSKLNVDCISFNKLRSTGSGVKLGAHVEGIFNPSGVFPYFALACVIPARVGGETRIFDARSAAQKIMENSALSSVLIQYSSLAYPDQKKSYRLVERADVDVLRYRQRADTNSILENKGMSEDDIYDEIDQVLESCVVLSHRWKEGDILIVNNKITLHDRLPFSGEREMLRVRWNDVLNCRMKY